MLGDLFRGDDIAVRFEENVFGVFAKDFKNKEMLAVRCNKFIEFINDIQEEQGESMRCFIGVAYSPKFGKTFDELYESASKALLMAKKKEKSTCCIYNGE